MYDFLFQDRKKLNHLLETILLSRDIIISYFGLKFS